MAKTLVPAPEKVPVSALVECRVLKLGDGRISNGKHIAERGDEFYEKGETFKVARDIAETLENVGFVEIV